MIFINTILVLINVSIGLVGLGLITGFSPTLFVTQAGLATRRSKALTHMLALIAGVGVGTLLLAILFRFLNSDTVFGVIDSAISASIANAWFNISVGVICIVGGLVYSTRKNATRPDSTPKVDVARTSYTGVISFAAAKTILSASGAAAVFLAVNLIVDANRGFIASLIMLAVYLAATLLPFWLILFIGIKSPTRLQRIKKSMGSISQRSDYRRIVGLIITVIGASIIVLNVTSFIS